MATVRSAALQGVNAVEVDVEVDMVNRLPAVCITGLPVSTVRETADRVRSAILAMRLTDCPAFMDVEFPRKRVVIHVTPLDMRKNGTAFDLPIAVGILATDGLLPAASLDNVLLVGELSMAGVLRPVRGVLAMAVLAQRQGRTLILSPDDARLVAQYVPGCQVIGVPNLRAVCDHLKGVFPTGPVTLGTPVPSTSPTCSVDMRDVVGQDRARRALEIAAAGGHTLHLHGPPGCGKSLFARRLHTILPPLTAQQAQEVANIHNITGLGIPTGRPFRAPHHSVTRAGLLGTAITVGEVSLAHHGVLFLDDVGEFNHRTLRDVVHARRNGHVVHLLHHPAGSSPADIALILASTCTCRYTCAAPPCTCAPTNLRLYSWDPLDSSYVGPLGMADMADMYVELHPEKLPEGGKRAEGEPSAAIQERVVRARARLRLENGLPFSLTSTAVDEAYAHLASGEPTPLPGYAPGTTFRARRSAVADRVLEVAWTISALAEVDTIDIDHWQEALSFLRPQQAQPTEEE